MGIEYLASKEKVRIFYTISELFRLRFTKVV